MSGRAQISATVSATTKEKLDRFARSRGLRKSYVVEQALLYFIGARRALPNEAFIPTRLLLADDAFDRLVALATCETKPTVALRRLMRGG